MVSEIKAAMDIGNLQNDRQSELGLVVLEIAIAKFDSLAAEATRLAGEVQKIASTEAELLRDESLSEAAATKRLIERLCRHELYFPPAPARPDDPAKVATAG